MVCILFGICIGWYLGYMQPTAKNQRELLNQYHYVRDNFHMTDKEMAEIGPHIHEYFEDVKRQDEMAAALGLGSFKYLERGDVEGAKKRLLMAVGSYYRLYHNKGGDTNLISKIEDTARKSPALAAEIVRKIE